MDWLMDTGSIDVTLTLVLLLLAAGLLAGWIDAVVGGGGLIQLPVLLMVPGITPVQALATNKLGSIAGTTASALTYLSRVRPDKSATIPASVTALLGAILGARVATLLPTSVFESVILTALIAVAVFTLLKPQLGLAAQLRFGEHSKRHHAISWLIGLLIGFYDGLLGPGTGSFLVIAFVSIIGFDFLHASAMAKVVNWATNLGALLYFVPSGHVIWALGAAVAAGNVVGGFIGARTAIRFGSGFVRVVFLIVVSALILTLGFDFLA
ncbi:TSUP family transporter [Brevibacterium sp. p3-SID960]|uniref:sulfite exporter TauE/SafE family protein n=1 Tax=Brevibacterium sp. p3-SID960 TaxID=2916063 RepID=UPI0021A4EE96|nr:TSUP family transporter [Brevibacterium sp. p3-SID960]MCT1689369.1 TSUP family transporter [Brevibacterium sp. p3-SID960]